MTRRTAKTARHIITDSHGAAAELSDALGIPTEGVTIVPVGVSLPIPCPEAPRSTDGVLAIASADPRKNFAAVTAAFSADARPLTGQRPCLTVVCTDDSAAERVAAALCGFDRPKVMLRPDDQALSNAYACAAVFVWPSRYEGFGLPPLEAMACGCPVLCSSAPTMPEVLGDIPIYFDPSRPDELVDRLRALLADPDERAERGRRGRAHAANFTCRRMADETVSCWHRVLGT
jgi:glycosyltransferase involved in cell wall biosynthesis